MIEAWFDGACEPVNPGGTMSCGIVVKTAEGKILWQHSQIVKHKEGIESTNNTAEYAGLWCLLNYLIKNGFTNQITTIRGDSQLVIKQMWGTWKMQGGAYVPLARKCQELIKEFSNVSGQWVPREQNEEADKLSKDALEKVGIKARRR
jgi:ribonuclease HI